MPNEQKETLLCRTEMLLGREGMQKLAQAHVAVFGIGGVGSFAAEALIRSGIGAVTLVDKDTVSLSNCNRQLIATQKTVGRPKVEVMAERAREIRADVQVYPRREFFLPQSQDWDFSQYSYIIDAVDTVSAKIELAVRAQAAGVPIISSMGAGNKLDPAAFRVADLYETSVCPLARVMRRELRRRGITHMKVVYSTEPPRISEDGGRVPGSVAFVPSVAGLMLAGAVVRELCGLEAG
ncbi:tRNA threonylcarbamoyladenosine dehydratase [Christensenellaceae bacterium NSJ-63]|uniref:tRNA threonylcarbamoyladenosine dehydratase n=1 Tax=Guopingia tenuis TaxID=2763656 RepID=A0A926HX78_9FIRM|nr:tRNA threonylcarbamoyladenosine dehydratase [Guopingia tenuis]MBC8538476.1 tRNA threonylcarbamoyladenosine dehydratase [Guopingia tenuis]MBS5645178.1 tRNA threonylcarbamoyladenosine dehydratase [Clostridiales bacterium]